MEWIYLIGYLIFVRYHIGYILYFALGGGRPDGVDLGFGIAIGSLCTLAWPITVPARIVYVLYMKFLQGVFPNLNPFPPPRAVLSREDKIRIQKDAHKNAIVEHRRTVNERERELGMTLTRWDRV